jgi:hypothetical protein
MDPSVSLKKQHPPSPSPLFSISAASAPSCRLQQPYLLTLGAEEAWMLDSWDSCPFAVAASILGPEVVEEELVEVCFVGGLCPGMTVGGLHEAWTAISVIRA